MSDHILNNIPIDNVNRPHPSHHISSYPNFRVMNMGHQELLSAIANAFERNVTTFWIVNLCDEAVYRGLITINGEIPVNREQWNQRVVMANGYVLPA